MIDKHVRFIDDLPNGELPYLYSSSDIFIMPHRIDEKDNEQEGFGIVFLEANACGLPVIGGNSGGVVDIIENGKNGFLLSNENEILNLTIILSIEKESTIFHKEFLAQKYNWES